MRMKANVLFPKKKNKEDDKKNNWESFAEIRKCGILQITALIKTQNAMK
jgi:hypothetical protein